MTKESKNGKSVNIVSNGPISQTDTRPTWEEVFWDMALLVRKRSRDETKVGAVIVSEDQVVLATGFNGLPRRVADLPERLEKKEKLRWIVHAEVNAILNAATQGTSIVGATIYTTKFPCSTCAGAIIQSGLIRVVCYDDELWRNNPNGDDGTTAIRMLMEAGVAIRPSIIGGREKASDDGTAVTGSNGKKKAKRVGRR